MFDDSLIGVVQFCVNQQKMEQSQYMADNDCIVSVDVVLVFHEVLSPCSSKNTVMYLV